MATLMALCGMTGQYSRHLGVINEVIGKRQGTNTLAAMNYLDAAGSLAVHLDTHINENPTAEEIAEMTLMAAEQVKRFGIHPKVALLSYSNFGSGSSESARKMSRAAALLPAISSGELEVDGEMHGDAALSEVIRHEAHPDSPLKGEANLLVMPNIDAANISYNLLKMTAGEGVTIAPHPARRGTPGACADGDGHRASPGQHDRAGRGGIDGALISARQKGAEGLPSSAFFIFALFSRSTAPVPPGDWLRGAGVGIRLKHPRRGLVPWGAAVTRQVQPAACRVCHRSHRCSSPEYGRRCGRR